MILGPNSKGGLLHFSLSPINGDKADAAFQKSMELLKALMKSGSVVLIRGVFFQSPLGPRVTQRAQRRHESSFIPYYCL